MAVSIYDVMCITRQLYTWVNHSISGVGEPHIIPFFSSFWFQSICMHGLIATHVPVDWLHASLNMLNEYIITYNNEVYSGTSPLGTSEISLTRTLLSQLHTEVYETNSEIRTALYSGHTSCACSQGCQYSKGCPVYIQLLCIISCEQNVWHLALMDSASLWLLHISVPSNWLQITGGRYRIII